MFEDFFSIFRYVTIDPVKKESHDEKSQTAFNVRGSYLAYLYDDVPWCRHIRREWQ
jgi:hypothetical protein